ncbi:hypothetical protein F5Y19DRAFT_465858 [Xylariaceae sp. FL1651]|nr:hypothetical protein F5Y19DRAFT_465858 [Xylariaceae sp. FL1651]
MSLNGLDDVKVKEAHDTAIAEPGGWFLLKYASRDEIEVLDRGNGGIVEIRNAIAKYEEPSPLYGFLRYRRRNVIIKYIPENCSRLVQARAAVHFTAICDRFTHTTTFEIAVAKDLKDSKLSAACSLHAASGSSSSSNSSLRRRRLNEIAEEEEEEERERKRQSIVKEEERPTSSVYSEPPSPPLSAEPPVVLSSQQITDPQGATFASTKHVPDFKGANVPASPTKSEFGRRLSSQSARNELYSSTSYNYGRPKVKLGPRPSLDANKRPSTAENIRPTAALPAGFKFFKGSKKGKSQDQEHNEQLDQDEHGALNSTSSVIVPIPELLREYTNDHLPPRPATSSGASVKSITPSMATTRDGKMTPEKARLVKAMKLREKKMQSAKSQPLPPSADQEQAAGSMEATANAKFETTLRIQSNGGSLKASNADSTLNLPMPTTIKSESHSEDTVLGSHPSSPGAASSTCIGESTKASSLSESTDETIQVSKDADRNTDEKAGYGPEELSETEDADLQTSASKSENIDVLSAKVFEGVKEFSKIPEHDRTTSQTTGTMIRESIEFDNFITDNSRATLQDIENIEAGQSGNTTADLQAREDSNYGNDKATHNTTTLPPAVDQPSEPLGVPLSKFSSNEARSPTSPASPTIPSLKSKFSRQDLTIPTDSPQTTSNKTVAAISIAKDGASNENAQLKTRPEIAAVEPIRTDLPVKGTPPSEFSDPLDDDALMDELQTATVQEAKPISVSKSPITPKEARLSRAVSSPMRGSLLMPGDASQGTGRSVSSGGAAFLHNVTRQPSSAGSQAKKNNIGSTISQRIKALEALSGNPNEEARSRPTTPSATFFTVRKPSIRESSKSPSLADRANSLTQPTPDAPALQRERSGSVASKLNMFEGQNAPRGRPESIQVTARIIRDSNSPLSKLTNPSQTSPTLLVDVQRAQSVKAQPLTDRIPEQKSGIDNSDKKNKRRSSIGFMKDFLKEHTNLSNKSTDSLSAISPGATSLKSPGRPPSVHQNSSGLRRLSTSSRRSSFTRERDNMSISGAAGPSSRVSDSGSADDDKSLSDKKSKNRTSRFMRRLSNSFGGSRKNTSASISPTVTEEDVDQLEKASILATQASSPTIVAFLGDVNVQFPDNLLWKRRSMCLDAQGFLVLSLVQGATTKGKERVGTKRFHLGDFRKPYLPDVELQELPNSVLLDFIEGSCLQIACEDRAGQQNVLRTLQEAHQSHAAVRH